MPMAHRRLLASIASIAAPFRIALRAHVRECAPRLAAVVLLLAPVSCSGNDAKPKPAEQLLSFKTDTFTLAPGAEKYMCYTKTLTEDVWIDRFSHAGHPDVHHMVLVRTLVPEPEQPFECPTFFKPTWIPLFATGTSNAEMTVPAGSSFPLAKGTQLLIQLHLLNSSVVENSGALEVQMRKVAPTQSEAGIYAFGTTLIDLPAAQVSSVSNDCTVQEDVNFFAVFPHMHTLGKSLVFERGPDAQHLQEEYRVDPWDFGDQFIAPHPMTLHTGDLTRTTCTYDNTRTTRVTFGESTENEMCFFVGFRTQSKGLAGCLELGGWSQLTPHGDAGTAATDAATD